jgi:SAM-dependent methyltransferase
VHDLFEAFAHRYDLHTPPEHYQHDHRFVLEQAGAVMPSGRLLDIGCGTGAFLEKAVNAGFDAYGTDAAEAMVRVATERLGPGRVRCERMQDLVEHGAYDVVCALSWTIHYAQTAVELDDIVRRCTIALKPGGRLLLQVANATAMTGAVRVDREPGPAREPDDTLFIHRFRALGDAEAGVMADYVYASQALGEVMSERHHLRFCDPEMVVAAMSRSGLGEVVVVDPESISPFVVGAMPVEISHGRKRLGVQ